MSRRALSSVETVAGILEDYANRGVFRGFSPGPVRQGKAVFKMVWHRDRALELVVDAPRSTIRFPLLLPDVPARSAMYHDLGEFIKSRHSGTLPEHRRINTRKARARCLNRGSGVAISLKVNDGDWEYGTRKLIHLVNEIFMVFLSDGRYHEYIVSTFDLEPDVA